MPFYPVNLQIEGRPCAVVGGGIVAERKVLSLLSAGAGVTVFSPKVTANIVELVRNRRIVHVDRPYRQGDIVGFFIVICATDDSKVNSLVAEEARQKGILVNVVDDARLGDFSVPAQVTHGDLLITVSTGGKSPALSGRLRAELAERYGPEYGLYLELVSKVRCEMKNRLATAKERGTFWQQALDKEIVGLLRQGKIKEAEDKIKHAAGCIGTQS